MQKKRRKAKASRKTTRRKTVSRRKAPKRSVAKKKRTVKRTAKKKTTKRKTPKKAKRKASGLTKMTYSLSPDLQAICGSGKMSRPQVVKKLWAYIKAHKCQDETNRRMINPDKKLAAVIGARPCDMLKLASHISKHIKN